MMAIVSSSKQLALQNRKELFYNVFATLNRLEIDASPVNYELMYEIVSGNNPELREKFARLAKPISEEELDALARTYLPHHFGTSIHDQSANRLQGELTTLKESLLSGQNSLSNYTSMLGQATGKISSADPRDMNTIRSQLRAIRQMTEVQHSASTQILERVSDQLSSVAAITGDVEAFERTKFTHLVTNLANRRGFNKRLAELYGGETCPDGVSLLLCNLLVLDPFEAKELIKIKEAILERLGLAVTRAVQATDFAAWLERPQIGMLVWTTAEAEIQKMADQLRKSCLAAFDSRQAKMPAVVARFGCSTTYDASTAAELVGQAEKALQAATDTTGEKVVFFSTGGTSARKDWMLYRR
ncbi:MULTISPECIES: diguanylate cyclase domain-containing protein [Sinorhizobium]|uniref:Diguanylate cyclase n=2 Tax=Sinorhizobium TaxID=28105 RepID=A0A2S3YJE8_9HYPH|nr:MULTISPECIES: diguanylate cyclase [Sinorhizobium]PDT41274.1 diguanylate cyclase [Sinorhizobium sp. FG01]POH27479.1 diguanylate cyclase [Sinorhizobium americanum]